MSTIKLDLHIHTTYSKDAFIKPADLIEALLFQGFDGCAICDHGSLDAYHMLEDEAKRKNLILIPGMEIETNIGEVIGLFLNQPIQFNEKESFLSVASKIRQIGGLVVIPHPFDFLRRNRLKMDLLNERIIKKYIDGIEVMNSRILFSSCVDAAKRFQTQYKNFLFEVGGSDAHTLGEIGNGYTLINGVSERTLENIKTALLAKNSLSLGSTCSPYVHIKTVLKKFLNGMYF
jgi:predicted metal-dependent phosphoesterase TrpH